MPRSVYIKRFFSALLLLIFALSITPKRFLHDAFARHIDSQAKKNNGKPYQLTASGYNCDTDNLVAESTFLSEQYSFEFPLAVSFSSHVFKNISFTSTSRFFSRLRGPPVNI